MKVEYQMNKFTRQWFWRYGASMSVLEYTRRRDAVRGFERFCSAIRRVKA